MRSGRPGTLPPGGVIGIVSRAAPEPIPGPASSGPFLGTTGDRPRGGRRGAAMMGQRQGVGGKN